MFHVQGQSRQPIFISHHCRVCPSTEQREKLNHECERLKPSRPHSHAGDPIRIPKWAVNSLLFELNGLFSVSITTQNPKSGFWWAVFGIAQVKTNQVALLLRVYGSLRIQARDGGSSSSFSTLLSGSLSAWESSSRTSSTRFDFVSLCLVTHKNEEINCQVWKLIAGEVVPLKLRLEIMWTMLWLC